MKKRCIIVVGNLASGKTSVCEMILRGRQGSDTVFLSLDIFRHFASVFSTISKIERENMSHRMGIELIERDHEVVVFETTGSGRFFDKAVKRLIERGYELRMIQLRCDSYECLRRHYNRLYEGYQLPPFPYSFDAKSAVRFIADAHRHLRFDVVFDSEKQSVSEIAAKIQL